jgi:hypothetical protein
LAPGAPLTMVFGMAIRRAWVVVPTLSAGAVVLAAFWTGRSTPPEPISASASLAAARAPAGPMADAPRADRSARADGLDVRLRQRELSTAEALRVKGAILEATVTDPAERQQQLQQRADAVMRPVTTITTTATADPRQPRFDRSQAAIVAAWSSQPAALRDCAALARQLDALRTQTFTRTGP